MTWPSPEVVERAADAIFLFEDLDGAATYMPWYRDMARVVLGTVGVDALVAAAERRGRVAALREAEAVLDLPGCDATGYYASEQVSGYNQAERHACDWLRARADEIERDARP